MESQGEVTMAKTNSAIQLYRALERANLLQYFDQFIAQGGDDLQQLCEAEEGEFFEIMELVGMSSKPLHVRRLQKVLQEYMADPKTFETQTTVISKQTVPPDYGITSKEASPATNKTFASLAGLDQYSRQSFSPKFSTPGTPPVTPTNGGEVANLSDELIVNVRTAAMAIIQEMDMQSLPLPKKIPPEMRHILDLIPEHPQREEEIRKWAPIYGRFDSKRKSEKPLSLHEVTVNEASCQLCLLEPNLLFMRDRLFPLSRQVVRESGYQYKHGQSRSNRDMRTENVTDTPPVPKRPRLSVRDSDNTRTVQAELMKLRREERMNEIANQLTVIKEQQANLKDKIALAKVDQNLQKIYDLQIELEKLTSQQLTLMTEQTDLIKRQRRSDRYYGSKSSRHAGEDISRSGGDSNRSSPRPADEQLAESEMGNEAGYTNGAKPVSNGSPKPDGKKPSRRKGTPKSHQAFMKQTLMDEGLRLAQSFNNGLDDEYSDPALQNYRLEDDHELRRAYGLKETTIPVSSIKTEDFNGLAETSPTPSAGHIKRADFIKSEPLDDAALGLNGTDVNLVGGQKNDHVVGEQSAKTTEDRQDVAEPDTSLQDRLDAAEPDTPLHDRLDAAEPDTSLHDSDILQGADSQGQRMVETVQQMGTVPEQESEEQSLTVSQQYDLVSQHQDMAFPQDMLVQ